MGTLRVEDVLTTDQMEELREVQSYELAAAAAEVACEDQGIDVQEVQAEVQREYLQEALADF